MQRFETNSCPAIQTGKKVFDPTAKETYALANSD